MNQFISDLKKAIANNSSSANQSTFDPSKIDGYVKEIIENIRKEIEEMVKVEPRIDIAVQGLKNNNKKSNITEYIDKIKGTNMIKDEFEIELKKFGNNPTTQNIEDIKDRLLLEVMRLFKQKVDTDIKEYDDFLSQQSNSTTIDDTIINDHVDDIIKGISKEYRELKKNDGTMKTAIDYLINNGISFFMNDLLENSIEIFWLKRNR